MEAPSWQRTHGLEGNVHFNDHEKKLTADAKLDKSTEELVMVEAWQPGREAPA